MDSANLVVQRPIEGRQARARAFRVVVDGNDKGAIRAGGSLTVALTPGYHTVMARVDWTGSPAHEVMVNGEAVITVRLRGNVLSRNGYLRISEGQDQPTPRQIRSALIRQMLTTAGPFVLIGAVLLLTYLL